MPKARRTRQNPIAGVACPSQYVCRTYRPSIRGHRSTPWNLFASANKGRFTTVGALAAEYKKSPEFRAFQAIRRR